jgi:hypothetical protein
MGWSRAQADDAIRYVFSTGMYIYEYIVLALLREFDMVMRGMSNCSIAT